MQNISCPQCIFREAFFFRDASPAHTVFFGRPLSPAYSGFFREFSILRKVQFCDTHHLINFFIQCYSDCTTSTSTLFLFFVCNQSHKLSNSMPRRRRHAIIEGESPASRRRRINSLLTASRRQRNNVALSSQVFTSYKKVRFTYCIMIFFIHTCN